MKYLKPDCYGATTYLSYQCLDKAGVVILDARDEACFARIFSVYGEAAIPIGTRFIDVIKPLEKVPYDPPAIILFCMELTKMGLSMECLIENSRMRIRVDLENYLNRIHVKAALILTRCIWETGICLVADNYFEMIEREPDVDKFIILQRAHKEGLKWSLSSHAACNKTHDTVAVKVFWDRIKAHKNDMWGNSYISLERILNSASLL